jgi:hypothetical protein
MTSNNHRRQLAALLATIVMFAGVLFYTYGRGVAARTVPEQLTDQQYWQIVEDFSEPNGYFRSDNLLSNENAFQHVVPTLQATLPAGGVYLGVGPEQNFTYIAAIKPRLAFIVDIRRGNMNLQLLYKAFMELSRDRADFLSHLFARPRPADVNDRTPVEDLLDAYELAAPNEELFHRYLREATDHLTRTHKFALTADDIKGIEYVYNAFYKAGPDLNYSFSGFPFGGGGFRFPTYATLMTETDAAGQHRSYLATEANYRIVADMEKRNAIVSITGDFAGPKALRSVGRYLKNHDATVTAIYTSNVEQYLFQSDTNWRKYYGNVATLPIDAKTTFIRSVSNRGGFGGGFNGAYGPRAQTRLCSVAELLAAFNRGQITGYYDVIAMSR